MDQIAVVAAVSVERQCVAEPERTLEGVLYEFDASGLIAAGLDPARMKQLPERGRMSPGVWYFLPKRQLDPHHAHAMPGPTIAIAVKRVYHAVSELKMEIPDETLANQS